MSTGPGRLERLLERLRHLRGLQHRGGPLGHALGDGGDVHGLEVFLVQAGARRLAGDAQDGDGVRAGRVKPGDHVGAGGAAGADAHADVAGDGAGVALGHVAGALDMARQDVAYAAMRLQRRVQRVDGGAGHAERNAHALFLHHLHGGLDSLHSWHCTSPSMVVG
jgi:hypothetical protein